MIIDPNLQTLCCNICLVALAPSHVKGHLHNKHSGAKFNITFFNQLVEFLELHETLPLPHTTEHGVVPFKGLKIHDGFQCNLCSHVLGTKKNMHLHYKQAHSDAPLPYNWSPCKMQQYARGGSSRILWRVFDPITKPSHHAPSPDDPLHQVIRQLRNDVSQNISKHHAPQDERIISPWLRITRWHEHVAGHDINLLQKLVQVPDKDNMDPAMPGIKRAVEFYFQEALACLKVTDDLILQKLNSPDPQTK